MLIEKASFPPNDNSPHTSLFPFHLFPPILPFHLLCVMESSNERTSLVHVNSNGTGGINSLPHHRNYSQDRPTRTGPSQEESPRRDPRTLLAQVQRSAASFQAWAARILHAGEDSSKLSWVQNARVARTFAMIMNALLAVRSFAHALCATRSHAHFLALPACTCKEEVNSFYHLFCILTYIRSCHSY